MGSLSDPKISGCVYYDKLHHTIISIVQKTQHL